MKTAINPQLADFRQRLNTVTTRVENAVAESERIESRLDELRLMLKPNPDMIRVRELGEEIYAATALLSETKSKLESELAQLKKDSGGLRDPDDWRGGSNSVLAVLTIVAGIVVHPFFAALGLALIGIGGMALLYQLRFDRYPHWELITSNLDRAQMHVDRVPNFEEPVRQSTEKAISILEYVQKLERENEELRDPRGPWS
ncbi:hypothetical protein RhiJN_20027 [Ceratobasidium sp. AG-Ba]|nr:hypothetical protein RhiJN_20027 [Ceratobasidium sp. AG-Ba]